MNYKKISGMILLYSPTHARISSYLNCINLGMISTETDKKKQCDDFKKRCAVFKSLNLKFATLDNFPIIFPLYFFNHRK